MQQFPFYLKKLRQRRLWSQEYVADILQLSPAAYSKIETGITDINLSRLFQLAEVFDVSIPELLSGGQLKPSVLGRNLEAIYREIAEREAEIMELQTKLISLLEELHRSNNLKY